MKELSLSPTWKKSNYPKRKGPKHPNQESIDVHRSLATMQWIRYWFAVKPSCLYMQYHFTITCLSLVDFLGRRFYHALDTRQKMLVWEDPSYPKWFKGRMTNTSWNNFIWKHLKLVNILHKESSSVRMLFISYNLWRIPINSSFSQCSPVILCSTQ